MLLTVLVDREGRIAISHAGVVDPLVFETGINVLLARGLIFITAPQHRQAPLDVSVAAVGSRGNTRRSPHLPHGRNFMLSNRPVRRSKIDGLMSESGQKPNGL